MNVKALIPIVVGVIIALIAYEMVVKKMIDKDGYEEDTFDD